MKKDYNYHYVYRITNIVTGYHYYGSKSCNEQPKENIGKRYFSTSTNKLFIQDQKNNPQDYKYKIIKIFETTREYATQLEVDLHKKFDVKNHPKFINKANQTSTKFNTNHLKGEKNHFYGKTHSTETKKILSDQRKGQNTGKDNHFYGKKHSKESLEKMSNIKKGLVSVEDKNGNRFTVDKNDVRINFGELVTTNKLNAQQEWFRKKLSENHADISGAKNPRAKKIEIYNSKDELMYQSHGNFKQICDDNDLPFSQLYMGKNKIRYAFDNMTPQTETKHRKKGIYPKFKGWYAKVVD